MTSQTVRALTLSAILLLSPIVGSIPVGAVTETTVSGSITDANGDPIEGRVISDNEPETNGYLSTIQSDGSFEVRVGTNEPVAIGYKQTAPGGPPRDGIADVYPFETVNTSSNTSLGSYTAPQGYVTNVTVVDQNGTPVEDATVMVQPNGQESFNPITIPMETNVDGKATYGDRVGLELTGPVDVSATRLNQTVNTTRVDVTGPTEVTLTVPDPRRANLSGRIVNASGDPVVNDSLSVYVEELYGAPKSAAAVTNTTGAFDTTLAANVTQDLHYYQGNLDDRNAGNQTYFPTDDTPDVYAVRMLYGSDVQAGTITLPTAHHVDVEVVTPDGTPVEGATVDLYHYSSTSDAEAGYSGVETNANGLYEIPSSDGPGIDLVGDVVFVVDGPNGAYTYENVNVTQDQTVTIELDVNEQTVPLSLAANQTSAPVGEDVRLTVTDGASDPVEQSTVTVEHPDGSTETLTTNATGDAVFSTATTGNYTVTASKPGTAATTYLNDSLTLSVREPGRVVVDSVALPSEVVRGEDVTAAVELSNPGGFEVSDTLAVTGPLSLDTTAVTLAPGETRTVFQTVPTEGTTADTLSVTAETNEGSVTNTSAILEPANVSVDGYTLSETTIFSTDPVAATATLNNTGEVEGTTLLNLSVDGAVVESDSVTVAPGTATATISTLVAWDSYGTHTATVAGRPTTDITVLRPTNPDASVTVTSPADDAVLSSGSVTLAYDLANVSTGIDHVEYSLDGGSYQTLADGFATTSHALSVGDGDHTVSVRLVDNLGTVVDTSERAFAVDSAAPVVGVAADRTQGIGVNDPVDVQLESTDANPASTTFLVTNASGTVFQTDVTDEVADGVATVSWNATTQSGTPAASGQYTFEVTSTDAAGNTNATTQTVTVDDDAPTVDATGVTDGTETTTVYVNGTETITVSGTASDAESDVSTVDALLSSDVTSFETRAAATVQPDGNWSAGVDASSLPDDGEYTVGAEATDGANNDASALNGSLSVVVDREAPDVGAAILNVSSSTGTVNVTANEPLAAAPDVTVVTPSGTEESVSLTQTATGWNGTFAYDGDGEYRIVANATDRAGNTATAEATATVQTNIQTANRSVVLTNGQSGTFLELHTTTDVNEAFGALTESDTPVAELSKQFSGSQFIKGELGDKLDQNLSYALVGIPVDESRLSQGVSPQDIDIRRFNETTKEWELVGTTTVETRNVTGTPTDYYVVNVSHFSTYGAVAPDTTAPTIDGSSLSGSGSPYDYSTDTVDVTFDYSDTQSGVNASTVTVALDGTDVTDSYAGDLQVTSSSTTLTAVDLVGSGSHDVTLEVVDEAGNVRTTTTSFTVDADTTAPTLSTSFTDGQTYAYGTETVSFDLTYADAQSGVNTDGVSVTLDGSDVTSAATVTSTGVEYTATDLSAGTHTIDVSAPDDAGNVRTTTKTFTIEADTTDPTVTSVTRTPTAPSGSLYDTTTSQVTSSFEYTDGESGIDASAVTVEFDDGTGYTDVTGQAVVTSSYANYTAFDLGPGSYTVRTTVVDAAGNELVSERSFTIGSGTAPQITGTSLSPSASGGTLPAGTSAATVSVTYDDAENDVDTGAITATFDGTDVTSALSISSGTVSYDATGLSDGSSHTFSVDVVDSASNTDSTTVTFEVGTDTESGTTTGGTTGSGPSNSVESGTATDPSSTQNETVTTTTEQPTDTADETTTAAQESTTTSTVTPTVTSTTTTVDSADTTATDAPQTTESSAPGFGTTTVLGALAFAVIVARRRL